MDYSCPEQIPLTLTVIDYRGQTFVSIHLDRSPAIELQNATNDINLLIAQAEYADPALPSVAVRNLNDEHFDWFTMVPPMNTIFYTPPAIEAEFPDQNFDKTIALIFAVSSRFWLVK